MDTEDRLVVFQPSGRRGRFALGTPLLDAARSLGVYIESVCGGRAMCARCQIEVTEGRFDTYGVVTQEAAASGLPMLISRHAGSSINLVKEGQNGHVITPENTACFAARLQELMTHPQRWPAMGAVSRMLAESFCVRRTGAEVAHWMLPMLKS